MQVTEKHMMKNETFWIKLMSIIFSNWKVFKNLYVVQFLNH